MSVLVAYTPRHVIIRCNNGLTMVVKNAPDCSWRGVGPGN